MVTVVVTSAFVIAMVPLVSVLFTVVIAGTDRFDVAFFTQSMRGVVGEGGGALPRDHGHAHHHRSGRR